MGLRFECGFQFDFNLISIWLQLDSKEIQWKSIGLESNRVRDKRLNVAQSISPGSSMNHFHHFEWCNLLRFGEIRCDSSRSTGFWSGSHHENLIVRIWTAIASWFRKLCIAICNPLFFSLLPFSMCFCISRRVPASLTCVSGWVSIESDKHRQR